MAIHIGNEIKKRMGELNLPVVTFAKKINRTRNNIYSIYRRKTIDTDLLQKISQVLRLDFFKLYTDNSIINKEIDELRKRIERLKEENNYQKKIISALTEKKTKPSKRKHAGKIKK